MFAQRQVMKSIVFTAIRQCICRKVTDIEEVPVTFRVSVRSPYHGQAR
jgi:hypothetical protein